MKSHIIKCWPQYFNPLETRQKTFEIRENDRDYKVGDTLVITEWDPDNQKETGRWEARTIIYMVQGVFGLPQNVCVLGFR